MKACAFFYASQCTYNPQMTEGEPYKGRKNFRDDRDKGHGWYGEKRNDNKGERYPRTNQFFASEYPQSIVHPTQKPVALMEYLIRTYTNEGEVVLDPTMGSGTTGVACVNTGRKFVGIETDDTYFDIAKTRILESEMESSTPKLLETFFE
jgi:DNA modification methylase